LYNDILGGDGIKKNNDIVIKVEAKNLIFLHSINPKI